MSRPRGALRIFARWLLANTSVVAVADVSRDAIEDFKVYLAARPGNRGGSLSENTQRQRLRTLRVFFERIIEWDWADTPPRNQLDVIAGMLGRQFPKVEAMLREAAHELTAFADFPVEHWKRFGPSTACNG